MRILNFLNSNNDKHKSIRIKTNIGDKFVSVNLDQTYESMDILSLKVYQKDVYRLFDADYGIIVGRVLANGVGIPNCRISVFVPINEETIANPINLDDIKKIEAAALYPFKTVLDKDGNGKVYNLLPKYSRNRNFNGFPDNDYGIGATPKTPVGSFLEKEEVVTNETVAYVYDKYYKFSTITNESGDYILTVPSNRSYSVNMCCDITDIGRFSTTAALLKLDGLPDNFFTPDGLRINENIPLERLPNIDIQNQGITVKPLWSQNESNTNVGINRLDFQLTKKIQPFITVVGNQFTQNARSWWGDKVQFRLAIGIRALCFNFTIPLPEPIPDVQIKIKIPGILPFIRVKVFLRKMCTLNGGKGDYEPYEVRVLYQTYNLCSADAVDGFITDGLSDDIFLRSHVKGNLDIKLFSIKNTVSEIDADILNNPNITNNSPNFKNNSFKSNIELYSTNDYITYQYNGNFIVLVNCNRNKVITNENGDLIPVDNNSAKGVYTSFRGYFYLTNESEVDNPPTRYRVGKVKLKVPQFFDYDNNENKWIWKHFKFDFGKIYSVAQQTMVRFANMSSSDESINDFALFEDGTTGLPNDNTPKAYANQTNLLLIGENEDSNFNGTISNTIPIPNDNVVFPNYINAYNHILYLGDDSDDNETGQQEVLASVKDSISEETTVDPINNNTYEITMRIGGSIYSENTSADNTTPTYFTVNGLIFDSLSFRILTPDDEFPLPSNLVFNYKIQTYNSTSGFFEDLFDFQSSNDLLDVNDNPISPIPLDDVSNSFYSLNDFRISYDLISDI